MARKLVLVATPTVTQPMCRLDEWWGAACAIQVVPAGGAEYTVDYSFDDPNDPVFPVPLGSMFFSTSMVPGRAIAATAGTTFSMMVTPRWGRVTLMNGVGSVACTWMQLGIHSRSNILGLAEEILMEGPNLAPLVNGLNGHG